MSNRYEITALERKIALYQAMRYRIKLGMDTKDIRLALMEWDTQEIIRAKTPKNLVLW